MIKYDTLGLRGWNLKNIAFTIVIAKDPESGWLVGEVVELPGCYSQAPDLPALETNMKEAITAYLKIAVDRQEKPAEGG